MLTQTQIDKDKRDRERLGPIAAAVGLSLDAQDRELLQALAVIADRREEAGGSASKLGAVSAASAPRSASASTPATYDLGDQVAECMRARNEGRQPAAWATSPLPSQRNAGGSR